MTKVCVGEKVGDFGYVLRGWHTDHGSDDVKLMKMTLVHTMFRIVNFIRIQRKLICSDSSCVVMCGSKKVRKTPVDEEPNSSAFFLCPRSCCIARCRVLLIRLYIIDCNKTSIMPSARVQKEEGRGEFF